MLFFSLFRQCREKLSGAEIVNLLSQTSAEPMYAHSWMFAIWWELKNPGPAVDIVEDLSQHACKKFFLPPIRDKLGLLFFQGFPV